MSLHRKLHKVTSYDIHVVYDFVQMITDDLIFPSLLAKTKADQRWFCFFCMQSNAD